MPLLIELLLPSEIAALESVFGPITVIIPAPIQSLGERPEPDDPDEKHEYFREMMESNQGPVLVR